VDRSIEREKRRLDAERDAALADQKRIADAERQARETAENARAAADVARRKLRNRLVAAASAAVIAVSALILSQYAWLRSQRELALANQALAEGLLNNLDLTPDRPLTERQRNTLWKLATSPEAVHRHFISILSASPEEVARVAARFGAVSRSLGLQWPSPAEAEQLLSRATAAVEKADARSEASVILSGELAARLTGVQIQQAVAFTLQRISQTKDRRKPGAGDKADRGPGEGGTRLGGAAERSNHQSVRPFLADPHDREIAGNANRGAGTTNARPGAAAAWSSH
jgi:hypothetical protein